MTTPASPSSSPQPPLQEIRLPWYVIVGGMIIVTVIIMFTFSKPLDTTPPQESPVISTNSPQGNQSQ